MRGNREGGSHLFCSSRPNNRIGINISKAEFHIAEQTFIAYICNYIIYIYIYIYTVSAAEALRVAKRGEFATRPRKSRDVRGKLVGVFG